MRLSDLKPGQFQVEAGQAQAAPLKLSDLKPGQFQIEGEAPNKPLIDRAKGYLESTVIDQLPLLGGSAGGLLGGVAGGVAGGVGAIPGSLAGAGVGGYLGKSVQNLYNQQFRPEQAPKNMVDVISGPIESGAENIALESLGIGLGNVASGVKKSLSPAGKYISKKAREARDWVGNKALDVASDAAGVSRGGGGAYAKDPRAIDQMNKRYGGDVSLAADDARGAAQKKIQEARSGFSKQARGAIESADPNANVYASKVIESLENAKAGLDPRVRADAKAISQIDDYIEQVRALQRNPKLTTDSATSIPDMDKIKSVLQDAATPSYDAVTRQPIFQGGPRAARAAKSAAAAARGLVNDAAPSGYREGNKKLEMLHRIEDRMNRNLIKEGKPEAGLLAAGGGSNARNSRILSALDSMTGSNLKQDAANLAAMRDFGNPNLLSQLKTGRSVLGAVTGAAIGGAEGGDLSGLGKGAAIGLAISSPAALKIALKSNAAFRGALGSFARVLESAASRGAKSLETTMSTLVRQPEFINALERANKVLLDIGHAPQRVPAEDRRENRGLLKTGLLQAGKL